ncbi:ArsR/SmtB family transcription factor [Haloglomus litoreum]|uniref:ArsR/SmtB family transcription factor n=1 Tax=Haloglomus litoreum TaxID=3034026 RepID=UPI0023E79413|nr:winged helix-turn-helix domain-containing protein [Haloglomus sp. DT116]
MRDDGPPFHRASETTGRISDPETAVDADELLSLLGDEYAREILSTLGDQSLPAREIVDRSSVSRPTVYRRLDRLEEAGLVETTMSLHPDGHHRKEFRIVVDAVELRPKDDTLVTHAEHQTAGNPEERLAHASD